MYFSSEQPRFKVERGATGPRIPKERSMGDIRSRAARLTGLQSAVAAIAIALSAQAAPAQTARTIKIVVPVPPGGAGDILARQLAEQVAQAHGITVVTENRPGAGTVIGTESVARAASDANTFLLNAPYLLINPQLRKVNYDPLRSFEPVCYLVSSPGVFVVNSASPYRKLADLIDAARAKPGELTNRRAGSPTRCVRPRSKRSSPRKDFPRSECAAPILPRCLRNNTETTAASFAKQT
jgi:hypothetical protein